MKCQARIVREYKTRKAECAWPETVYGPSPPEFLAKWPTVCGGDVRVTVRAVDEPYYGGTSAALAAEWTCSRCREPFVPGRIDFDGALASGALDVTDLLAHLQEQETV